MKKIILSMFAVALTAITFTSCEDVPAPYDTPSSDKQENVTPKPVGDGTAANPFNAIGAINFIKAGQGLDQEVYVKGKVVTADIDTRYGNATYFLSEDGTTYFPIEIYRGYGLDGMKFTATDQMKEGDDVVVCGKLVDFKGTMEMTTGSRIITLNGKTISGTGEGTIGSPYNVEKALSMMNTGFYSKSDEVYISGKISEIKSVSTKYGNADYFISDDGTTANQLKIFRGFSLQGEKFTSRNEIKVGDDVVISGKMTIYKSEAEIAQGSKIVSLNGSVGTLLNETFASGLGSFKINNISMSSPLKYVWKHDSRYKYMKASAYVNRKNIPSQSRLESAVIDFSPVKKATLTFQHTGKFFKNMQDEIKVQVSTDGKTWEDATIKGFPTGKNWTFVNATVDLSKWAGQKKVQIGFLYTSTTKAGPTWEIKNVLVK